MTAIEIREALEKCYPDVTDLESSIKYSGFAHEHPLIAIGVLLISSIVLETTAPRKLAQFTRDLLGRKTRLIETDNVRMSIATVGTPIHLVPTAERSPQIKTLPR